MRILLLLAGLLLGVLGLGLLLRLLKPLPSLAGRTASAAPGDTGGTRLGRAHAAASAAHPGLTGILPLADARDSFAARVLLIRLAERSLDLQYYIWLKDISGRILLDEVEKAASRGVRVRLLLDDNGTSGLDRELAALHRHPNIEVRLFNPFTVRRPKAIGYAMDFLRLNRRMHNKSLTADNQMTIVGGRNLGDAYFGASQDSLFADLDVLAAGAVVPEVSADFDRYWNSPSAYPADLILPALPAGEQEVFGPVDEQAVAQTQSYQQSVAQSPLALQLQAGTAELAWCRVRMVSDDPAKALGKARESDLLIAGLLPIMGKPKREMGLVSAYFVPTSIGTQELTALVGEGVKVSVLTNALNATDVAIVHAGYAKQRRALLKGGVRLFEMMGEGKANLRLSPLGSRKGRPVVRASRSALHAKTFTTDRHCLFVGSFNFDPRSALLNTELGFVIENPKLAGELQDAFDTEIRSAAYEVVLAPNGHGLNWIEETPSGPVTHEKEPQSGPLQRGILKILALLPIDWLL